MTVVFGSSAKVSVEPPGNYIELSPPSGSIIKLTDDFSKMLNKENQLKAHFNFNMLKFRQ